MIDSYVFSKHEVLLCSKYLINDAPNRSSANDTLLYSAIHSMASGAGG